MNFVLYFALICELFYDIRSENRYGSRANQIVDYINNLNTTWKASTIPNFQSWDYDLIKKLMGVNLNATTSKLFNMEVQYHDQDKIQLPDEFDSRIQWPDCPTLHEVRDQGACGSCWAFGAVEAMSDRICISSNGAVNAHISAEDLLTCCDNCGFGCDGGQPQLAWAYYRSNGIVTGGQFGSNQGCLPYEIPHCDHHTTGIYKPCSKVVDTPKCVTHCESSYNRTYKDDKNFAKKIYYVPFDPKQIQSEIMQYGPVEAIMIVFEDFLQYKSGVYKHVTGDLVGGHAVKIIGWGVQDNTSYWLSVNSWNQDWGQKGFFKILRGTNECGIEAEIYAGLPNTEKQMASRNRDNVFNKINYEFIGPGNDPLNHKEEIQSDNFIQQPFESQIEKHLLTLEEFHQNNVA
ncbi:unnamed protein product [Gordionus sp. m RMFG-2023]|uniref:cathepsin B-like n=1 Tax=Gordionus sp. m RMFG-2023 TaxID=3053472 RepID=UPI0030E56348